MSSRIFVRGLPPTFTEFEFRSHFAQKHEVTDARLIPHRRIGYVGYKTPAIAEAAVKYFNKSFIRMSKIGVEIAKSVAESREMSVKSRRSLPMPAISLSTPSGPTQNPENTLKRKRDDNAMAKPPPNKKLQEFLDVMRSSNKSNTWSNEDHTATVSVAVDEKDDDYTDFLQVTQPQPNTSFRIEIPDTEKKSREPTPIEEPNEESAGPISDADWLRSKTSRLLDLTDHVETILEWKDPTINIDINKASYEIPSQPEAVNKNGNEGDHQQIHNISEFQNAIEIISQSGRLFIRNLSYTTTEDDIRQHFSTYGNLQEIHLPMDVKTQISKGFVYVLYKAPSDAVEAYKALDGTGFQGRLLHIIPAVPKRDNKLDEFAISKLPLKKQRELKRKAAAATSQFSWNSMYMNADAILSSVASKLGVSKTDILDPTSSDAAVKQAHAETHVIQETKAYLSSNGVDLDAFKLRERDDKIVLLKNFPFGTKADELRTILTEYGPLSRFLMPPAGTIAIAEFQAVSTARAAFTGLAYRRFKDGILFLEKGPKDLFSGKISISSPGILLAAGKDAKLSVADLKDTTTTSTATITDDSDITTLFVRNLSFSTTSDGFTTAFSHIPGFLWAKVKLKPDPKREGGRLSMGFGFVGVSTPEQARNAIVAMDGHTLDGHKLLVKVAHRTNNDDDRSKKDKKIKEEDAKRTKIIIKNLPFEVTKKDVRSLFGKYGTLRTVRMPKKLGNHTRGFAFAEFVAAKEAANAIEALKDTHLLGRRLVLDYANQNSQDAEEEIERMSKKVSEQADIVAVARLKEKSKSKVVLDERGAVDDID